MAKVFVDRISKRVDEIVRCTHSNQVMGRIFAQYYLYLILGSVCKIRALKYRHY